jgi:hypothetical protein
MPGIRIPFVLDVAWDFPACVRDCQRDRRIYQNHIQPKEMTMDDSKPLGINDYVTSAKVLRESLARWHEYSNNSRYDKKGLTINTDSRFRATEVKLSIESWAGTYGSSSCSSVIHVSNAKIFQNAFERVIQSRLVILLTETAQEIDCVSTEMRQRRISQLENELNALREIEQKAKLPQSTT